MKSFSIVLLALLLPAMLAFDVPAQSYSIDWFTIDGGGGTSTGIAYSVNAQSDPSASVTGSNYSLTGGFWSLSALQTAGLPLLSITRSDTNTGMVSWPSTSTSWILQQITILNSSNWNSVPEVITDNGALQFIIMNPPAGNRFYRLFRP